ncbi:NAD(P)/FAD-dependent oxidoreductase [Sphingomonas sp. PAMC 26617]|uniref:NAD(P)/FAD-dependent oxidoreductase n=1 Tax=Sphingomonas sp. PAMC 26617 TaxID=1112216 RepID=UPI000288AC89|nr:NAD(P)-binding protein [Sphingomonas sp. PAMC 26617]
MKIAIVGAGIAGSSCGQALQARGHAVSLFDKGRGAGGRMATRRVDGPDGDVSFDHGAQYFTARDPAFGAQVEQWAAAGIVAAWPAAGEDAWVGTPGMNALVKAITDDRDVTWGAKVDAIRRGDGGWLLDPVSDTRFDAVIVATPAEQAGPLLVAHDPAMAAIAQACPSAPCWTAMVAFEDRVAIAGDIVRDSGIIGWAARNSAKPGRGGREAWVVQATPHWSRDHLEDAADGVVDALLSALATEATQPLPATVLRIGHRWRYAKVAAARDGALWDPALRIGAVGDWLLAPRVESAWLSGRMLADRIGPA